MSSRFSIGLAAQLHKERLTARSVWMTACREVGGKECSGENKEKKASKEEKQPTGNDVCSSFLLLTRGPRCSSNSTKWSTG